MELRLDPDTQRSDPPSTPLSVEAAEILRVLRAAPLTKRQERILRMIASRYYREGQCYARQSTIAAAIGCAKSTLQLDLDELEARGLIRVHRRQGTSNVTIFADGLIEALKAMRINRCRTRLEGEGVEVASTTFRSVAVPTIVPLTPHVPVILQTGNRPKDAQRPGQYPSTSLPTLNIPITPSPRAQERESTHDDVSKDTNETVQILIREGVTPKRAVQFARLFDADRIEANVNLGLHRTKKNPGGYLVHMIQHDIAAAQITPGSEAARVRTAERASRSLPSCEPQPIAISIPAPSKAVTEKPTIHDDTAAKFALLTPDEQAQYEAFAAPVIRQRLAHLGNFFDTRKPTVQAMIRARALQEFADRKGGGPNSLGGRAAPT